MNSKDLKTLQELEPLVNNEIKRQDKEPVQMSIYSRVELVETESETQITESRIYIDFRYKASSHLAAPFLTIPVSQAAHLLQLMKGPDLDQLTDNASQD